MQDRTPKYPGRVALIPVPGADNIYDMVRADEPIETGNPLSKVTFLKDATATLLGFTNPKSALPDDAFKVLNATYGTCGTSSGTVAKVVVCPNFILKAGARIAVRFSATNTANNPTLNVNGTGAIAIARYGTTSPFPYMWQAGSVVEFFYDGSRWIMTGGTTATTTYYGPTILYDGIDSTSTTMAATANSVRSAYRKIIDENINPAKITVTASKPFKLGDIVDISGNQAISDFLFSPGEYQQTQTGNWPEIQSVSSNRFIVVSQSGSGSNASGSVFAYSISNGNITTVASRNLLLEGHDGEYPSNETLGNIYKVADDTAIIYGHYASSATGPDVEEFSHSYRHKITISSSSISVNKRNIDSDTIQTGGFQISGVNWVALTQSGSNCRIAKRKYNISENKFSEGSYYTFIESGTLSILHAFNSDLYLILKSYQATSSSKTQYTYQVRDYQGNLKSSIAVPDEGEDFVTLGVSSTKAIVLRYDGVAYIITISSSGSSISLSEPIKVFNRTADLYITDGVKKSESSALYSFRMGGKLYVTEIRTDGSFIEPILFESIPQGNTSMGIDMVGDSLAYMKFNSNWEKPTPKIYIAVAEKTNNSSDGLAMFDVSTGQTLDVCLDGNMKWNGKARGESIINPMGEQIAYCYANGLVNVVGKWKKRKMSSDSGGNIESGDLPTGVILIWSGSISDIPEGWALCDGSNGTPNLKNNFVVGAGGEYNVGATGGKKQTEVYSSNTGYRFGDSNVVTSVSTENRPPYYALAYIMKV